MSGILEFTVLGCGSSGGVPRADGDWGACDPAEPKNRRTRCSLLVRRRGEGAERETTILIDTSPDLVRQTSTAGAKRLDAVLLTHDHADQIHGFDDIRAFALRQGKIPTFMSLATAETMLQRFGYAFRGEGGYPAIAQATETPPPGEAFEIDGPSGPIPVMAFDQEHGASPCVGFRFGPVAYSADVVGLLEDSFDVLSGIEVWIVDALRERPHPTHAHLALTLEWIERVRPRRAILTNLHVDMDYRALLAKLPQGVEPAYDGLRFEVAIP